MFDLEVDYHEEIEFYQVMNYLDLDLNLRPSISCIIENILMK